MISPLSTDITSVLLYHSFLTCEEQQDGSDFISDTFRTYVSVWQLDLKALVLYKIKLIQLLLIIAKR